jgi:hypothetical protein
LQSGSFGCAECLGVTDQHDSERAHPPARVRAK